MVRFTNTWQTLQTNAIKSIQHEREYLTLVWSKYGLNGVKYKIICIS